MTYADVAPAPLSSDMPDLALRLLDEDVIDLFADVDAILCAALRPRRRPPAVPVTGSAFARPRLVGPSPGGCAHSRRVRIHQRRATQRSPPPLVVPNRIHERQVVTSHN
jgi:hypothetical protein